MRTAQVAGRRRLIASQYQTTEVAIPSWPEIAYDTLIEDYAEQCEIGRTEAEVLISRMTDDDAPYLLGFAARAMAAESWTGRQAGFFQAIAERLR